jgi:hypothetical protein
MDLGLNIIDGSGKRAILGRLYFAFCLVLPCVLVLMVNCATVKQVKEWVHKDYGPKRKVMLVGMANRTGYPMGGYIHQLEEVLLAQLKNSKYLQVVGSPAPSSKKPATVTTTGQAMPMDEGTVSGARQAGVSVLITGDISEFEIRHLLKGIYGFRKEKAIMLMHFRLEAIDVETGAILYHNYRKGELKISEDVSEQGYLNQHKTPPLELANSSINALVKEAADALADQPWKGFVTEVTEGRVSFSAGEDVGLTAGTRLEVRSRGGKMVNFIGNAYQAPGGKTGTICIETVNESSSTGAIEKGGNVQPGDTLIPLTQ